MRAGLLTRRFRLAPLRGVLRGLRSEVRHYAEEESWWPFAETH